MMGTGGAAVALAASEPCPSASAAKPLVRRNRAVDARIVRLVACGGMRSKRCLRSLVLPRIPPTAAPPQAGLTNDQVREKIVSAVREGETVTVGGLMDRTGLTISQIRHARMVDRMRGGELDSWAFSFGMSGRDYRDATVKRPGPATGAGRSANPPQGTRTPSVRMKNAEDEARAQKQEDELAALFDTPEFGIMGGNERTRYSLDLDESRLGGSLGIPDRAVPNRAVVETVRRVLEDQGEASARAMRSGRISCDTAEALFSRLNSDAATAGIFRRVFPVAQALGIRYSLAQYSGQNAGVGGLVLAQCDRGEIRLFTNTLQFTSPQTVASTILTRRYTA